MKRNQRGSHGAQNRKLKGQIHYLWDWATENRPIELSRSVEWEGPKKSPLRDLKSNGGQGFSQEWMVDTTPQTQEVSESLARSVMGNSQQDMETQTAVMAGKGSR